MLRLNKILFEFWLRASELCYVLTTKMTSETVLLIRIGRNSLNKLLRYRKVELYEALELRKQIPSGYRKNEFNEFESNLSSVLLPNLNRNLAVKH